MAGGNAKKEKIKEFTPSIVDMDTPFFSLNRAFITNVEENLRKKITIQLPANFTKKMVYDKIVKTVLYKPETAVNKMQHSFGTLKKETNEGGEFHEKETAGTRVTSTADLYLPATAERYVVFVDPSSVKVHFDTLRQIGLSTPASKSHSSSHARRSSVPSLSSRSQLKTNTTDVYVLVEMLVSTAQLGYGVMPCRGALCIDRQKSLVEEKSMELPTGTVVEVAETALAPKLSQEENVRQVQRRSLACFEDFAMVEVWALEDDPLYAYVQRRNEQLQSWTEKRQQKGKKDDACVAEAAVEPFTYPFESYMTKPTGPSGAAKDATADQEDDDPTAQPPSPTVDKDEKATSTPKKYLLLAQYSKKENIYEDKSLLLAINPSGMHVVSVQPPSEAPGPFVFEPSAKHNAVVKETKKKRNRGTPTVEEREEEQANTEETGEKKHKMEKTHINAGKYPISYVKVFCDIPKLNADENTKKKRKFAE